MMFGWRQARAVFRTHAASGNGTAAAPAVPRNRDTVRNASLSLPGRGLWKAMLILIPALVLGGVFFANWAVASSRPVNSREIRRAERDTRRRYGRWYNQYAGSVRYGRTVRIKSPGRLSSYGAGSVRYSR